jgi:PKD repeat protein
MTYTGLAPGSHSLDVRATDFSNNTDPTPAERIWTVQPNIPPEARFVYDCTALTCNFDAGASTDPDGSIASYSWTFGDGASGSGPTTVHGYGQQGGYLVTLTVTDNEGAAASLSKTVTLIRLSVRGYKVRGHEKVDLSWAGPSGTSFDVYRNGSTVATVQAGAYTDDLNGHGTFLYKVCAPAISVCSNTASVTFP